MHLLAAGRTIVDVMQKLRHTNIATTSIYLSSNPEAVQQKTKTFGDDLLTYSPFDALDTEVLVTMQHSLIMRLLKSEVYQV